VPEAPSPAFGRPGEFESGGSRSDPPHPPLTNVETSRLRLHGQKNNRPAVTSPQRNAQAAAAGSSGALRSARCARSGTRRGVNSAAGLVAAAELLQRSPRTLGSRCYDFNDGSASGASTTPGPRPGRPPSRPHGRLSSTTGDGRERRGARRRARDARSRSAAAVVARAWQAAIAGLQQGKTRAPGSVPGPGASGTRHAARPRRMSQRIQRERSWSSSKHRAAAAGPDARPEARKAGISIRRPARGPPARLAQARRECGRGAARPRTGRDAANSRPRRGIALVEHR